jgi:hypothetical protein
VADRISAMRAQGLFACPVWCAQPVDEHLNQAAVISSVTQASFAAAPTASPACQAAAPAPSRPQPPTTGRRR